MDGLLKEKDINGNSIRVRIFIIAKLPHSKGYREARTSALLFSLSPSLFLSRFMGHNKIREPKMEPWTGFFLIPCWSYTFLLCISPQCRITLGSHWDQEQIMNFTVLNKQCWWAGANCRQTALCVTSFPWLYLTSYQWYKCHYLILKKRKME